YLTCYLSPLLHCFYQHDLVFMPHGENLIMLLENNVPWVADGFRSLGSSVDRREFQSMLVTMLRENNIE
ncbi:IucA/IucC family C-terminal-domain containing protein, partial [Bacillus subtilis]|uniref:IucA/IucC family C-terminal-domain containing protein n=1 Tax=Bacillus subtilis TaxID=1423 RepID=UPI0018E28E51